MKQSQDNWTNTFSQSVCMRECVCLTMPSTLLKPRCDTECPRDSKSVRAHLLTAAEHCASKLESTCWPPPGWSPPPVPRLPQAVTCLEVLPSIMHSRETQHIAILLVCVDVLHGEACNCQHVRVVTVSGTQKIGAGRLRERWCGNRTSHAACSQGAEHHKSEQSHSVGNQGPGWGRCVEMTGWASLWGFKMDLSSFKIAVRMAEPNLKHCVLKSP